MLTKRIVPCLDVHDGRVVKGVRFLDLVDAGDPVEQARFYDASGADELVFLDISATHEGRQTMRGVVRRAADELGIPLTVGGGVRTADDVGAMLDAGADKVAVNSAALARPGLLSDGAARYGAQCVVLAVDAKRRVNPPGKPGPGSPGGPDLTGTTASGWEVFSHGGRTATGRCAIEWALEAEARGAGEILATSMDRDGTKDGYDLDLLLALDRVLSVPVVASGGAGTAEHLRAGLVEGRASAALAASMFHFRETTVAEAKAYLAAHGVAVRPVPVLV
jgi:cyclase